MKLIHPKCGKSFPDSERTGHCAACCETFFGLAAFEQHQTLIDGRVRCSDPDGTSYDSKWWLDDKGRWHHGERMTEERKQELKDKKERQSQ